MFTVVKKIARYTALALTAALVISTAVAAQAAGTAIRYVAGAGFSNNILTQEREGIVAMPNDTIVALEDNWNTASLDAIRLSDLHSQHLFQAGNSVGQNPSKFSWQVGANGRLYVVYTTYTFTQGSGFATAGVEMRSTTDGATWTDAVQVLPQYNVGFSCTPTTDICGYFQPQITVAPNGQILIAAVKTTTLSHYALAAVTSTDGTSWSQPSNMSIAGTYSNSDTNTAGGYIGDGRFQLAQTPAGFTLVYPFILPRVPPRIIGDWGIRSVMLPFGAAQAWGDPINVLYNSAASPLTAINVAKGPWVAYSGNVLTTYWFSSDNSQNSSIATSNFDPNTQTWSTPALQALCSKCLILNSTSRQQSRVVATAAKVTIPYLATPIDGAGLAKTELRVITIAGGVVGAQKLVDGPWDLTTPLFLYGIFGDSTGKLSFLLENAHVPLLVTATSSGDLVSETKIMDQAALSFAVAGAISADGTVHMLTQENETRGQLTGTFWDYYQTYTPTIPQPVGVVVVQGKAKIGATISLYPMTFSSTSGVVTSTFQWYRCPKESPSPVSALPKGCVAVAKATAARYKLVVADQGKYLLAKSTYTNAVGTKVLFSDSTSAVTK